MKVILAGLVICVVVAFASAFFHHPHPEGHFHHEEYLQNETEHQSTEGPEGHHKKHHHHHHHHHHKHHHHWKCNGEPVKKNEEFITANIECKKEFQEAKLDNAEGRQKGMTCKSICAGQKVGYFDADGQVVQSKLESLIDEMITGEENQNSIKEKAAVCAHKFSPKFESGPSDEKCSNYKPYLKCVWLSTMQVCNPHFDSEDWE